MVKVSVISIVLNDSAGLQRTLDSVLRQEGVTIESIVIDGGSMDGTRDVIRNYSDKLWKWISEPDEGIFHAMDKGLALCSGDWVVFMNAGDCFASDSVLFDLGLESAGEFAVVYGSKREKGKLVLPKPVREATLAGKIFACHQAMAFNKRLLGGTLHYHRDYRMYADYELVARLFREGFRFRESPTVVVEFQGGGVSSKVTWVKRKERYRALLTNFGLGVTLYSLLGRIMKGR